MHFLRTRIYWFIWTVLGFELRASHLLGRRFTTWSMPSALEQRYFYVKIINYFYRVSSVILIISFIEFFFCSSAGSCIAFSFHVCLVPLICNSSSDSHNPCLHVRNWTQGLTCTRQVLYHWTIPCPYLNIFQRNRGQLFYIVSSVWVFMIPV
jgi:hypothetical protein